MIVRDFAYVMGVTLLLTAFGFAPLYLHSIRSEAAQAQRQGSQHPETDVVLPPIYASPPKCEEATVNPGIRENLIYVLDCPGGTRPVLRTTPRDAYNRTP